MKEDNLILRKSFDFAISIVSYYQTLYVQNEFVLSKQVLRAGTSIGANVEEAIGAHSKKDFISKMVIAYKEARETRYWLRLLDKSQIVKNDPRKQLEEIESIINILTAIIKTSKGDL